MNKDLLIVFAKNPEIGCVKTRLAKDIGDEKALAIYYKLLHNTRNAVRDIEADKAIFYDQYIDTEDEWSSSIYKKALQQGEDIGERMYNALLKAKDWGYERVGLIGADIYGLNKNILNRAFELLAYHDWVFGPAKDGGYYFVGCHRPAKEMFELKRWSHSSVLKDTLQKAYLKDLSVGLIDELTDIDTIDDILGTDLEKLL